MKSYCVRVTKDYLVFCAGHFISFENDQCERLHGHNYRVAVEITGPLDEDFLVIDFIRLKRILRDITNELDHRVMLAEKNPVLAVERGEREVVVNHAGKKRWVFPNEDCVILPIENTTAELLATWIAGRLEDELGEKGYAPFQGIRVEVEESPGQSALYTSSADSAT